MSTQTLPPPPATDPSITVVKVGGRGLGPDGELEHVLAFVSAERRAGRKAIIVHGGGHAVTQAAERRGLPTLRSRGQRITSPEMMQVVLEVLGGRINAELTARCEGAGLPARGILAATGGTLTVTPAGTPPGSLGLVGQPERVDPTLLQTLLADGITPVVAPIGADVQGLLYNVNADVVAGAFAGALGAPLLLLTDVPGVRAAGSSTIPLLTRSRARALLATGTATDGMIPKLEAALAALDDGGPIVWIGSSSDLASTGPLAGHGTRITAASPRISRAFPLLAPRRAPGRA